MSNKAIVAVRPNDWAMIQSIAQECYESRAFGVTKGEAAIKILFCFEHGLPLTAANQGLYVVRGRITPMGQICASQIRKHPDYDYKIEQLDAKGCTISISRHGEKVGEATFDEGDAQRAGLLSKDVWKSYPEDMYFNRAIGRAQRRLAPDALSMPVHTTEELGAEVDGGGEPVWSEVTTTITHPHVPGPPVESVTITDATSVSIPADPAAHHGIDVLMKDKFSGPTTIDALLAHPGWTAERIVVASEGVIPATAEDCQRVARVLEEQDAAS